MSSKPLDQNYLRILPTEILLAGNHLTLKSLRDLTTSCILGKHDGVRANKQDTKYRNT